MIKAERRGALYPYELVPLVTRNPDPDGPAGTFTEYDIDPETLRPVPVDRPYGANTANIVLGMVTTPTRRQPEGLTRVLLLGDPTRALGAIAEPECRRVLAAIDLAREHGVPVEWYAVSAGAKIAMDSGTENMDWISRVLRAIITFTQDGGEINVVVTGINVGAQPYWNAEATMLMHTRGILVMTPDSAMVLTGKQSLDYSGGVSAEDNYGIGGYDRIMGPNGQAQYWAPDLSGAVEVLLRALRAHLRRARRALPAPGADATTRSTATSAPRPTTGDGFTTLGEIFDPASNAERKKPFDIRSLMKGVADADHATLERWADMHAAESVVVLDAHLGGNPVELIGIESKPLPRRGSATGRRAEPVDGGHAVPPLVEEDGAGDQRRQRQPPGGRAGQPLGLRRLAGVAARPAARVRRGDRPGGGQLRRPDRVLRGLALPRRRLRRVLRDAQRPDGGRRGRGLVRLGDRRCARRPRWSSRATWPSASPPTRASPSSRPGSASGWSAARTSPSCARS